jgi:hypothetical protein
VAVVVGEGGVRNTAVCSSLALHACLAQDRGPRGDHHRLLIDYRGHHGGGGGGGALLCTQRSTASTHKGHGPCTSNNNNRRMY